MAAIVHLTSLPSSCQLHFKTTIGECSFDGTKIAECFKEYSEDSLYDMMRNDDGPGKSKGSTTTCSGSGSASGNVGTLSALKIANYMKKNDNNDKSDIINAFGIKNMGMDKDILERLLCAQRGKVSDHTYNTCVNAAYLNTLGITHGNDIVSMLSHFGKDQEEQQQQHHHHQSDQQLLMREVNRIASDLTHDNSPLDRDRLLKQCEETASQQYLGDAKEQLKSEENSHRAETLAKESCLNMTSILMEVFDQSLLPSQMSDAFLRETESWPEIKVDDISDQLAMLDDATQSKHIDLTYERIPTLREELYNITMPPRFRLMEADSTPSLDIILQTLLSGNVGEIRAFDEIINFADFRAIQDSSTMKATIEMKEKRLNIDEVTVHQNKILLSGTDWQLPDNQDGDGILLAKSLRIEFGRYSYFIVFLEMIRRLIPQLSHLAVGCLDDITVTKGDNLYVHEQTGKPHRLLPDSVFYVCKGWYYIKVKGAGFCSTSYRALLAKALVTFTNKET